MKQFLSLSTAQFKGFYRDRIGLFFTFLFPLIFLVTFGLLFQDDGASKTTVGVVGDSSVVRALPKEVIETKAFPTSEAAIKAVTDGDIPAALIDNGAEVTLQFAASDQVQAGVVQGVVRSVVDSVNLQSAGVTEPAIDLSVVQVEDESLTAIDFIAPGILSWGVAMSATFGAALTFVAWRRKQVLRRLQLTPVSTASVVGARVGVALFVSMVQAVVFIGLSVGVLGLELRNSWWLFVPVLLCGTLAFLAIGQLVGSFTKTEESASAAANLLILPMAFLSGVFFRGDQMPGWVQAVSQILPMRHMNDAILDVMIRGEGVTAILVPCAILLAFAAVCAGVATKVFRWDT